MADIGAIAKKGEKITVAEAKRRIHILAKVPAFDNAGLDGELAILVNLGMFRYVDADMLERTDYTPDMSMPIGWLPTDPGPIKTKTEPFYHDAAWEAADDIRQADLLRIVDARVEAALKAHGLIN